MTKKDTTLQYNYDQAFALMADEVEGQLSSAPSVIRKYTSHLTKSRGKFIRASALLACAMDEDCLISHEAVKLAAAIELLHLATLVHDDVIDNADLRRGVTTLQKEYGKKIAVICGDYLLSVSIKMVSSISDKNRYTGLDLPDYISQLCLGELRQEINIGNLNLSVYRYLSIINGKTASLFEAAFYGGAALIEEDPKRLSWYRRSGRCLGMIFQLTDDCIDYETEQDDAKKNVQSDYDQGVITLPLIHTLRQNPELEQQLRNKTITSKELYPMVRKSGGPDFTRMIAGRYYKKAITALNRLKLPPQKEQLLITVLDKAYYGLKKKEVSADV